MREGDVILTPILQADDIAKNRPALILRELPPFQDLLVCGISTQIHQAVRGFDEVVARTDSDFPGRAWSRTPWYAWDSWPFCLAGG